jgi:hypothetical protein
MTTLKQIEANRRNSRRSTGPRTRTGKAESKLNAMKHGLLAADLVVRGEDPVAFAGVLKNLVDEYQPQGPLEEHLVERVAVCMWRLRRVYRVEAEIFQYEIANIESDNAKDYLETQAVTPGGAFKRDAGREGAISKLSRYEAAIERSLFRALHELQRVQAAREEGQQPPSIAVDVTVDGLGPAPDGDD